MLLLTKKNKVQQEAETVSDYDEIDYVDRFMLMVRESNLTEPKAQLQTMRTYLAKYQFILDYISPVDMIEIAKAVRQLTSRVYTGKAEVIYSSAPNPRKAKSPRASAKRVADIGSALDGIF